MNFSNEMKEKIKQFAKEQSQYYLEEAEMTYLEKLQHQIGQTKRKVTNKLSKLKTRSNVSIDVQNDLILYMSDYMNDLMEKGVSEQEAFEHAKEELKFQSETTRSSDLKDKFAEYYENFNPADHEAIGLFYAGFMFFGMSIGGLIGFIGSGGRDLFLSGGWIDTLIGTAIGGIIGIGLGLISNAIIVLKKKG
ncbi:hypothetical protein LRS37_15355 [Neobacillus sedimentimangrovi]|jgi:hypothetical protein|uniref:Uncharacterized protein n=1 Tax=Neobacillus sedimentimangrovi TaxID=2699460 RepID=A0ABS8QLS5_9BACI|nr:hypothetical protein [Neobacillus sedimentimangrovi]MCD4840210.1 hypothetical protein [Neobacillus sedimentimangrovi]